MKPTTENKTKKSLFCSNCLKWCESIILWSLMDTALFSVIPLGKATDFSIKKKEK